MGKKKSSHANQIKPPLTVLSTRLIYEQKSPIASSASSILPTTYVTNSHTHKHLIIYYSA